MSSWGHQPPHHSSGWRGEITSVTGRLLGGRGFGHGPQPAVTGRVSIAGRTNRPQRGMVQRLPPSNVTEMPRTNARSLQHGSMLAREGPDLSHPCASAVLGSDLMRHPIVRPGPDREPMDTIMKRFGTHGGAGRSGEERSSSGYCSIGGHRT